MSEFARPSSVCKRSRRCCGLPWPEESDLACRGFPDSVRPNFDKDSRELNYLLYQRDVHELSSRLSSSQIAVYPIDVRGLQMGRCIGLLQPSGAVSPSAERDPGRWNTEFTMSDIARETGGEAFFNQMTCAPHDAEPERGTNYYTLAYVPQDATGMASTGKSKSR